MTADWLVPILGTGCGSMAAAPIVRGARRETVRRRFDAVERRSRSRGRSVRWRTPCARATATPARLGTPVAALVTRWSGHRAAASVAAEVARELPVAIDLLAVAVGAGETPYSAVEATARWAPSRIGEQLTGVMAACRLGADFASALEDLASATPALAALVDALLSSDRFGAPVGDALARLAIEERAALRRRAEARARTVPVRLLFPLVFLVLPAFGLLTVVPALLAGFART